VRRRDALATERKERPSDIMGNADPSIYFRKNWRIIGIATITISLMTTLNSEKLASLAKDLTRDYPRSPRELLAGYIIGMRTLDKCRAELNSSLGEYHFNCPLDNMFFEYTGITADQFKDFVATGANDQEVAAWVAEHAKPRERIEIIKWNNDLRYKRLSEMDDGIQEYMEDYIPQFVPKHLQHHIDYFFDIYDAEEKRMET
jgi:Domain of unknown function (DUF5069)